MSSTPRLGLALILALSACSAEEAAPPSIDVCEAAARHIESCTGQYLTPPVCDDAAAAQARAFVYLDCASLPQPNARAADGALCDWFGTGCPADEDIFHGAACTTDAECGAGSCVEHHCFAGVATAEMDGILADLTGSDVVGGNRGHVLVDNTEARQVWTRTIDEAQHSISVISLLFENNDVGIDLAHRLAAAARRGVTVHVMVDSISESTYGKNSILTELADAGVQVLAFNPVTDWAGVRWQVDLWLNQRIHEKIMVADGARAIIGGRNFGDSYLADNRWRDTDLYVEGPAVAELQRVVLGDWDEMAAWERGGGCPQQKSSRLTCPSATPTATDVAYFPALLPLGTDDVRVIRSNPRTQTPSDGYQTYLALIRGARHSIQISNAYFVPPMRLRRALKAAVARGVRVEVLTNSQQSNDEDSMWYASANFFEELTAAGVRVYEWQSDQTIHAKTMVVDGQVAVIGSYNLDPRSAATNSETLAVTRGPTVDELAAAFPRDLAHAAPARTSFTFGERIIIRAHRIAEPLL
jgi:cardiolipin synthase